MEVEPVTLAGQHVRLEPLSAAHADSLIAAATDGKLWDTQVTIIPNPAGMDDYIKYALDGLAHRTQLPFVIISNASRGEVTGRASRRESESAPNRSERIVGSTRFYEIFPHDRKCAIGYTWLAKSAQRTPVNTECKLLLLTHAFETWKCVRVELITDVLNEQSRKAILRLGAKQEGILRKHLILPTGRVRDSVFFSIIDEEWPEVKAALKRRLSTAA
jgi:N-acetyltransferase